MNDNEFISTDDGRDDREAAKWVAKRVKGFSPSEQDSFFEWLASDPRHAEWYARHMKTWKRLDQLSQWMPEHSDRPNQDLLKFQMTRGQWTWLAGIAAALALMTSVWFLLDLNPSRNIEQDSQSLVANQYESHVLPDGSIVHMNRGTALKLDYTPETRRVELIANEAHFDVAKDPNRPFIVHASGVDFRALGTAFNVKLTNDSVKLLVTEGRVQMVALEAEATHETPETYRYYQEVTAGQMSEASLAVEEKPPAIVKVSAAEVDEQLEWKPLMLTFDNTPLSEVVEAFNRRNTVQLVIDDAALGAEPIVASFHAANVEHFVELLDWTLGVHAERFGEDHIRLNRK